MLIGAGEWRKRNGNENWEEIRTQVRKHLLGPGKDERVSECQDEGDVRRGVAPTGVVKNSWVVKVMDGNKVGGDEPIEYFFSTRVCSMS